MNEKNVIVGIDVGTTKVCTLVGQLRENGRPEIIGIGNHPSHGLKKGTVVNIDKTINSIYNSLNEAKLMAGVNITRATIGIAGSHIYSFNSSGVVPIKGKEITKEDVERVMEAAKAVVIPSDREILHVIPQEFKVDNTNGIKNPVGMRGMRLEAHVHIVTGSVSLIHNLLSCVEQAGVHADNITPQPIASSEAVLSNEEKDLGVILVDIGGGTTDIAVWKEGSLIHSQIIPVGGNHFTNDLSIALKISHAEAERVKVFHGSVLQEKINQSAHITVKGLSEGRNMEVPIHRVVEVLGARAEELFNIINKVVAEYGLGEKITAGLVLTGGGALINGMAELGEYLLNHPVKIGYPIPFGGMTNIMQKPQYSTVLGLLLDASKRAEVSGVSHNNAPAVAEEEEATVNRFGKSLKSIFGELFY